MTEEFVIEDSPEVGRAMCALVRQFGDGNRAVTFRPNGDAFFEVPNAILPNGGVLHVHVLNEDPAPSVKFSTVAAVNADDMKVINAYLQALDKAGPYVDPKFQAR